MSLNTLGSIASVIGLIIIEKNKARRELGWDIDK